QNSVRGWLQSATCPRSPPTPAPPQRHVGAWTGPSRGVEALPGEHALAARTGFTSRPPAPHRELALDDSSGRSRKPRPFPAPPGACPRRLVWPPSQIATLHRTTGDPHGSSLRSRSLRGGVLTCPSPS